MLRPLAIGKCSLHDALTIIEYATHGKGAHAVAPAGELLLLAGGNFSLGKKNDDFHVAAFSESGSDGPAGISGGGHDNRSSSRHPPDACGEKARADIFERCGWSVEELQHCRVIVEKVQGYRKVERFVTDVR